MEPFDYAPEPRKLEVFLRGVPEGAALTPERIMLHLAHVAVNYPRTKFVVHAASEYHIHLKEI